MGNTFFICYLCKNIIKRNSLMTFTAENILLIGAILIFCSILISKTGYKFGIPTLLLFLLVGKGFGSDGL